MATPSNDPAARSGVDEDDAALIEALLEVRAEARALEDAWRDAIDAVPADDRASARNLVHYVALRNHDIRELQLALTARGLSSLGRSEAHVLATIDAVLARLGAEPPDDAADSPSMTSSSALLARHAEAALGPLRSGDRVRLMVTLPSEAATSPELVAELIDAGMDLARINGAHDDEAAWLAMARHVREEAARRGCTVRVAFDLAGPKLRTGPLAPGLPVVKVRPLRGVDGRVQRSATLRLVSDLAAAADEDPNVTAVPADEGVVAAARVGDEITCRDARDRRRRLVVTAVRPGSVDAALERTAYLVTGTTLTLTRDGAVVATGAIGELPEVDSFLRVTRGEVIRIRRGDRPGHPARRAADGTVLEPTTIGCELDAVFDTVAVGHRVLLDDGAIQGVVDATGADWFDVVVTRPDRAKLKAEKGINLPDTPIAAPALSADDQAALDAIAPHADLVSLSFVRDVADVDELRRALAERGRPDVAIGLKIEHDAAFAALPHLLLDALQGPPIAVMLARGDLAIEVGFERLAEVQEQVLWLCEAAHVPVIWATQVAESLAKRGQPTRAEVTDAAWASRAECVMLNKGPHIPEAIRFLDDIFERMHAHQRKRTPLLRRLAVSAAFVPPAEGEP